MTTAKIAATFAALAFCCHFLPASAQQSEAGTQLQVQPPTGPADASCCQVAEGTLVKIELVEALSADFSRIGQKVAMKLTEPLTQDGRTLVAAGTPVVGEVTLVQPDANFSHRSRGQLEFTARYIDLGTLQIPLRDLDMPKEELKYQAGSRGQAAVAQVTIVRTDTTTAGPIASAPTVAPAGCCQIANGTVVQLEIEDALSSAKHKRGDKFALRLVNPLVIDGVTVIPAGTTGIGEVTHAEHSRTGGKPGELMIAARSLQMPGQAVPLRGLRVGGVGRDNTNLAAAMTAAVGMFAMFVHGREIEIPAKTRVEAKVAQALTLVPVGASTADVPQATQTE